MKIDDLKRQAREQERAEEWSRALGLYRRAAEAMEEAEEPDISLYNRMADLHIRMGEIERAVERYEEAVDLYLESGLENNAVAVCRKLIRNVPQRPETFLRLGRIRADQGFGVDARGHFLTYARMQEDAGARDAALSALEEVVTRFPDDPLGHLVLAEGYLRADRTEEAVRELVVTRDLHHRAGNEDEARDVEEKIREVAPGTEIPEPGDSPGAERPEAAPRPSPAQASGGGVEDLAFDDPFDLASEPSAGDAAGDSPKEGGDDMERTPPPRGDLEFDDAFGFADEDRDEEAVDAPIAGFESTGLGLAPEETEEAEDESPAGGPEPTPPEDRRERDPGEADGSLAGFESFDDPFATDPGEEELEEEELEDDSDDEGGVAPLPLLDDAPAAPPTPPSLVELEDGEVEEVEEDGEDAVEQARAEVEQAVREGGGAALVTALERLAGTLEEAGEAGRAASVRERLSELAGALEDADTTGGSSYTPPAGGAPGEPAGPRTPSSVRDAEEDILPAPWLAGELTSEDRPGEVEPPAVEDAPELPELEEAKPADPAPSPPEARPDGDWVDLGSLVLDDDSQEGGTRWTVEAEEPSGDEDADFSRMLASFKAKVADNLSREDARSQYDLGAAFREMGLWDEAIAQFQQALRADPRHLGSYEMMGQCFLEKGEPRIAVRVLERATGLPWEVEDDLVGIYYHLGRAHEAAGQTDQAREHYEKVFSLDINFMDVTDRLRELR